MVEIAICQSLLVKTICLWQWWWRCWSQV